MLISVIIPVYNTGEILRETVQSVLEQTFRDFELLLIDDGSDEETRKIVDSFTDPRIRAIRQENRGIAGARNRGIEEARGKYIAFLDHDDLWLPEKLAVQLQMLENDPEAGLCYSPVLYFGDSCPNRAIAFEKVSGWAAESLLRQNKIASTSCIMVRKSCFEQCGTFAPECVPCDDWDLYLRLACSYRFLVTEDALVRYRIHAKNTSADTEKMYFAGIHVLKKNAGICSCASLTYRNLTKARRSSYARHCYGLAWEYAHKGKTAAFLHWLLPAITNDWTLWRAWALIPRSIIFKLRSIKTSFK